MISRTSCFCSNPIPNLLTRTSGQPKFAGAGGAEGGIGKAQRQRKAGTKNMEYNINIGACPTGAVTGLATFDLPGSDDAKTETKKA